MTPDEQHHAMCITQLEAATGQTWEHEGGCDYGCDYGCTGDESAYCYFTEKYGCTMRVSSYVEIDGAEVHLCATASDPDISRAWTVARNARNAAVKRLTEAP